MDRDIVERLEEGDSFEEAVKAVCLENLAAISPGGMIDVILDIIPTFNERGFRGCVKVANRVRNMLINETSGYTFSVTVKPVVDRNPYISDMNMSQVSVLIYRHLERKGAVVV